MNAANRTVGFVLATLSGCLWFVACAPFDQSYLAWIAAVPMLLAIDRAPTLTAALLLGWWAGIVETAGGFYWLVDTTKRFTELPWIVAILVFLLFCVSRGIIFLLFTGVVVSFAATAAAAEAAKPPGAQTGVVQPVVLARPKTAQAAAALALAAQVAVGRCRWWCSRPSSWRCANSSCRRYSPAANGSPRRGTRS